MNILRVFVAVALLGLAEAAIGNAAAQTSVPPAIPQHKTAEQPKALHDFDFLVGHWRVHHRRLKERLANSHEWIEFEGTLSSQPLMAGYSNVDDLVLNMPGTPYRGVALRSFDAKSQQWSMWWLDSRTPLGPSTLR